MQTFTLPDNRYVYVHVARGSIEINGQQLSAGDGARIEQEQHITLQNGVAAEVLLFDLRPNELALVR